MTTTCPNQKKRSMMSCAEGTTKRSKKGDPLEEILAMCKGEIIPRIPNLQLFHFMLVYGHCSGSEGVCMDSTTRLATIQNKVYERQMHSATRYFSYARANQGQSKFAPNDWTDTFCKLIVDVNIGLPRIQQFVDVLRSNNADLWEVQRHTELVASMMLSGCSQSYERRMVDLSAVKHPSLAVSLFFPSAHLFAEGGARCCKALRHWVKHLMSWICQMYSSSTYCCFYHLPPAENILRVPAPSSMGLTEREFQDWTSVVVSMSRRRQADINRSVLPKILAHLVETDNLSAESVEKVLVACWNQIAVLNMEIVNTILFYISYTLRDRGEVFIRAKLADLFCEGSKALQRLGGSPMSPQELTRRVASVMQCGGSISPVVCVQLVQFAQGMFRLLVADSLAQTPSSQNLQQLLVLDGQGIHSLQKLIRWVSHGVVAMQEGFRAIEAHFDGNNLLLATTCKQAFREAVLRIVHYRCFDTGRRFVMDAVHMLLRLAGHDLASRLLKMATCCGRSGLDVAESIAELVSSWHCITTMTTASFAHNAAAMEFEDEIMRCNYEGDDDATMLSRVIQCVQAYVQEVCLPRRIIASSLPDSPIEEREVPPEEQQMPARPVVQEEEESTTSTMRHSVTLPFMYVRSLGIVPVTEPAHRRSSSASTAAAAAAAVLESNDEEYDDDSSGDVCRYFADSRSDPTVAARQDPVASQVWEHCWRRMRRRQAKKHLDILPMFKPILMYGACFARNMVAVNAFYFQDHIAQAVALSTTVQKPAS